MQVFLLGFMGVGKTSIGKRLAARLNLAFIDMDEAISDQEQMSIEEIFKQHGEVYFRALEKEWISKLAKTTVLVSLGGGTPCQDGMMQLLNEKGITVYLQVPVEIIVSRLAQATRKRPLIEDIKSSKEELNAFVKKKLAEREPYYALAKLEFESSDLKATRLNELANLILSSNA